MYTRHREKPLTVIILKEVIMKLQLQEIARSIEISVVQSDHSLDDLNRAAGLALKNNFSVVYSLPCFTKELSALLKGSESAVGAVISFPSGGEATDVRVFQAERLLENGGEEFDMVMNIGYLKAGRLKEAREDISAVKKVIGAHPLKVIMEAARLTEAELKTACELIIDGGGDYAKTGTGWINAATTFRHIEIMADAIKGRIKMKASGGVRGLDMLERMYDMGVSRFGIRMDAAVAIYEEAVQKLG